MVASCKAILQNFSEANLSANLVCVTHVAGFKAPGEMEMPEDIRQELIDSNVKILQQHMCFPVLNGVLVKV